jgi:H+/gluconate symporter-like permease
MDAASELLVFTLGIITIIILTAKLRIHAFFALISVSIVMGLVLGISPNDLVKNIVDGFGGTLGYVGLLIFAATIIGELLSKTGATIVISQSILRLVGRSRTALAVGTTGFLVALPVTCNDTAFLILSPAQECSVGRVVTRLLLSHWLSQLERTVHSNLCFQQPLSMRRQFSTQIWQR